MYFLTKILRQYNFKYTGTLFLKYKDDKIFSLKLTDKGRLV